MASIYCGNTVARDLARYHSPGTHILSEVVCPCERPPGGPGVVATPTDAAYRPVRTGNVALATGLPQPLLWQQPLPHSSTPHHARPCGNFNRGIFLVWQHCGNTVATALPQARALWQASDRLWQRPGPSVFEDLVNVKNSHLSGGTRVPYWSACRCLAGFLILTFEIPFREFPSVSWPVLH